MRKFSVLFLLVVLLFASVVAPNTFVSLSFAQADACEAPKEFDPFTPDLEVLDEMSPVAPERDVFLEDHDLQISDTQEFAADTVVWEPGLFVVELDEELYGEYCLPLNEGWVYTVALDNGLVHVLWGGDPSLESVRVLWGFSARYIPAYMGREYGIGGWLDPEDPTELLVREHRFGRYLRNRSMEEERDDVPYFTRYGPYYVGIGNSDSDWNPPALTHFVPRDYRDAAALLGGLAREDEWEETNTGVWVWKYREKVSGSGEYCPATDPCWQQFYVPRDAEGYVVIWYDGGPVQVYADEWADFYGVAVDEFSYHPYDDPFEG